MPPAPGERLRLSALRELLDEGSAAAHWTVDPEGITARALVQLAETTVRFPMALGNAVRYRGRIRLVPRDWRDGRGAVRVTATARLGSSTDLEVWAGVLRAAALGGPFDGLEFDCELPADTTELQLGVARHGHVEEGAVARVFWIDSELLDPAGVDGTAVSPGDGETAQTLPTARNHRDGPRFSVLTPVHDPPLELLRSTIASVVGQTFTDWELCLFDDGSRLPEVTEALEAAAAGDERIKLQRRAPAGGISAATNAALAMASGEYVALLDHDDLLVPTALEAIAEALDQHPELDMLYSDEAVVGGQPPYLPVIKPGWSPENIHELMYTNHVGVYRRELALALGGFRKKYDGCQDYDFVLRLTENTTRIAHLPGILYEWRAHAASTASGDAKPYAYITQPRAIAEHLRRAGLDQTAIQFGPAPGLHRIIHPVPDSLTVSLVLPGDSTDGLADAARSWIAQPHPRWQVVLAGRDVTLHDGIDALRQAGIADARLRTVETGATSRVAALADAAGASDADVLVLMQAPAIGLTRDWLQRLLGYARQPGIAAAGAVVLGPDGRVLEAGVALPEGIPLHLLFGRPAAAAPLIAMNVSAVGGVVATARETYERIGGLRPEYGDLALVEYCLRAADNEQRAVIVGDARVRAAQPDSFVNDLPAIWRLRRDWRRNHDRDPYYNPAYRPDRGDYTLTASLRAAASTAPAGEDPEPVALAPDTGAAAVALGVPGA